MRLPTGRAIVSIQNGVTLPPDNEPQPDVVILRLTAQRYRDQHPQGKDVLLLIEVADSTLAYHRDVKVPIYAANGVAEAWVIDVNANELLVFRKPVSGAFTERLTLTTADSITPSLLSDWSVRVADLLR